jgi:hypothetical protein
MTTIEDALSDLFDRPPASAPVDVRALLTCARRDERARRRRRLALATAAVAVLVGALVLRPAAVDRGDALTLTESSSPVVVAAHGHVRFAGGLQVWRRGSELSVGYPGQSWASVDTRRPDGAGGRDGLGVFEDRGVVTSVVHATPRGVAVTLSGDRRTAEIACFQETPGWCVWAASFGRPLTRAETLSLSADPPAHVHFSD